MAARLRRLDEAAEVTLFERGGHVSFANCGLPYRVGDVITDEGMLLVDRGHLEGAVNVPLSELRRRVGEIPRDQEVWVYCAAGQRAYFAQRLLLQRGVRARNLSGGYTTWLSMRDAGML